MKTILNVILCLTMTIISSGCNRDKDKEPRLRNTGRYVVIFGVEAGEEVVELISGDPEEPVNYSFSASNLYKGFTLIEKRNNGFDLDIKSMRNEWLYAELDVSDQSRLRVILRALPNTTGKIRECIIYRDVSGSASAPYIYVRQFAH